MHLYIIPFLFERIFHKKIPFRFTLLGKNLGEVSKSLVQLMGLEPTHLSVLEPESSASTISATAVSINNIQQKKGKRITLLHFFTLVR